MKKPWQTNPNPVTRDGVVYVTKSCPICFKKFRWAEELCFECLVDYKTSNPEEDLNDAI